MKTIWPLDNYSDATINTATNDMDYIATALMDLCRFAPNLLNIIGSDLERYPIEQGKSLIYTYMKDKVSHCGTVADVAQLCFDLCSQYKYPLFNSDSSSTDSVDTSSLDAFFQPEQFAQESINYLLLQYLYVYNPIKSDVIPEKEFKRIKGKFQTQKSALLNLYSDRNFDYTRIDSYLSNVARITLNSKLSDKTKLLNFNDSLYDFVLAAGLYTPPMRWNPYVKNFIQIITSSSKNNNYEIRFQYNDNIGIPNVLNWDEIIQAKIKTFNNEIKRLERLINTNNIDLDRKEKLTGNLSYMKNHKLSPEDHLDLIKTYISDYPNKKMNCDNLQNFVNHFYLQELTPLISGNNFISVASYIVERITHFNFINHLYNIFEKTGYDLSYNLSIFAIFPLVSYRLKILESLFQYMIHNPKNFNGTTHYRQCITCIKDTENAFPIERLHQIIKYQSLFYFPLMTRLFHNLLFLKFSDIASEFSGLKYSGDNFILQDNICPLFNFDSAYTNNSSIKPNTSPVELCLCKNSNRRITLKKLNGREVILSPASVYDNIQEQTYKMYYEQVYKLRKYNFIDDGFKHLDKNFQFVKELEKELDLRIINECLEWDEDTDSPLYINF